MNHVFKGLVASTIPVGLENPIVREMNSQGTEGRDWDSFHSFWEGR